MDEEVAEGFVGPYDPVSSEYWCAKGRREVEEAGSLLVNTLLRVRVDIPNIEILNDCSDCGRKEPRISLGYLSIDETNEIARKIGKALDELDCLRKERAAEKVHLPHGHPRSDE
ncbi:hypothetical protein [Streptomyces tubercidicus]|uniref:hypothetical protein n=1 Tax=Streptomyces tubercidicus TaxID=47759 RepID=UPI0036791ACE